MTKTKAWLNDKFVKNWFEKLGNQRTQENYAFEFPKFLEYAKTSTPYKTPTEMVESRLAQLATTDPIKRRFWEDTVIKFKNSIEGKDLRIATVRGYLRTIQSFFSNNNVKLNFARNELKVEPSESDRVYKEWIPSNEEVRLLYHMAQTTRDRAILLMLYHSGFSEADVASMKIEDFDFYDSEGDWKIQPNEDLFHARRRVKTNQWHMTCISHETLEEIRLVLQQRSYLREGFLFVSFRGKRLDVREINDMAKGIVAKAFSERVKEWKTKHLRDAYMNALLKARIPQEVKDAMVGHKREGARNDYALTPDTIKTAYKEAFRFLSINGFGSTNRKIDDLARELEQTKQKHFQLENENKILTKILVNLIGKRKIQKVIAQKFDIIGHSGNVEIRKMNDETLLELYEQVISRR